MAVLVGGRISRPKGRGWGVINQELSQVPFERKRRAHGNHPTPPKKTQYFNAIRSIIIESHSDEGYPRGG